MTQSKNIYLISIIALLLITGLYINFILQKDFLTQQGFDGLLAVICICFFDASKIISEIVFFKMKGLASKIAIGVFAVILIFLSVYTTFSVRTWKSQLTFYEMESSRKDLNAKNKQIDDRKSRLATQLKSLEEQIHTKREMIQSINSDRRTKNNWLSFQYNKEIDKLNEQKLSLLKKIDSIDQKKILTTDKQISLHKAMSQALGNEGQNLELLTNLMIALVTDGIILFLCFSLSFLISQRELLLSEEQNRENDQTETNNNSQPKNNFEEIHHKPISISSPVYGHHNFKFQINDEENILFYDESNLKVQK